MRRKWLKDSILLVRKNLLEKRKVRLVTRMNMLRGTTTDEMRTINEMMAEKLSIDTELAKLKDMNE